MYVLEIKKGYVQIDEEYLEKNEWDGKSINIRIIPIGQIVINSYNKNLQKYLDSGGTVEEVLRIHGKGFLKVTRPFPPFPINSRKTLADFVLNDPRGFDLPYIQVCYLPIMGDLLPVFSVEKLEDLYFYDLMRVKKAKILIKECVICGKAFIAKTTAQCCSKQCKLIRNNAKRTERLDSHPGMNDLYQIRNTNNPRNFPIDISDDDKNFYIEYNKMLESYMENETAEMTEKEQGEFYSRMRNINVNYRELNRTITSRAFGGRADDQTSWKEERLTIFDQADPETWLQQWFDRIKEE